MKTAQYERSGKEDRNDGAVNPAGGAGVPCGCCSAFLPRVRRSNCPAQTGKNESLLFGPLQMAVEKQTSQTRELEIKSDCDMSRVWERVHGIKGIHPSKKVLQSCLCQQGSCCGKGKAMITIIATVTILVFFLVWFYALLLVAHDCDGMECNFCPYHDQCTRIIHEMTKGKKK